MIKKILGILIFGLISINAMFAQNLGNEWINYNQKYYKFNIVEDGIVRISYAALSNAGVPLSSINNPKNFQIFGRGQEQYIYMCIMKIRVCLPRTIILSFMLKKMMAGTIVFYTKATNIKPIKNTAYLPTRRCIILLGITH